MLNKLVLDVHGIRVMMYIENCDVQNNQAFFHLLRSPIENHEQSTQKYIYSYYKNFPPWLQVPNFQLNDAVTLVNRYILYTKPWC